MRKLILFALFLGLGSLQVWAVQSVRVPDALGWQATPAGIDFFKDYLFLERDAFNGEYFLDLVLPAVPGVRKPFRVRFYRNEVRIVPSPGGMVSLQGRVRHLSLPIRMLAFLDTNLDISNLEIKLGVRQEGERVVLIPDQKYTDVNMSFAELGILPGFLSSLAGVKQMVRNVMLRQIEWYYDRNLSEFLRFSTELPVHRATLALSEVFSTTSWMAGRIGLAVDNYAPVSAVPGAREAELPWGELPKANPAGPAYPMVLSCNAKSTRLLADLILQNLNWIIGPRPLVIDGTMLAGQAGVPEELSAGIKPLRLKILVRDLQYQYSDIPPEVNPGQIGYFFSFQGITLEGWEPEGEAPAVVMPLDLVAKLCLEVSEDGQNIEATIGTPYAEDPLVAVPILGPGGVDGLMKMLQTALNSMLRRGHPGPSSLNVSTCLRIMKIWREGDTVLAGLDKVEP